MAFVPVPGAELTLDAGSPPVDPSSAIPAAVHDLLRTLWSAGHAAYVVGGSLRDTLLGQPAKDWDLASSALPELTTELFPGPSTEPVRDGRRQTRLPRRRRGEITTCRRTTTKTRRYRAPKPDESATRASSISRDVTSRSTRSLGRSRAANRLRSVRRREELAAAPPRRRRSVVGSARTRFGWCARSAGRDARRDRGSDWPRSRHGRAVQHR